MWLKSLFDYVFALILLLVLFPVILILVVLSSIDTREFGIFTQERIGKGGSLFSIYKIRTMKTGSDSDEAKAISRFGRFLRKSKLDETPQIFNILTGQMSFVGPRPDVPGYADRLEGEDRIILKFKPGLTGPAQLAFRNEEYLLSLQENPLEYNDKILWPEKVRINKEYVRGWSYSRDLKYFLGTFIQLFK